jgi:hypothetical protein
MPDVTMTQLSAALKEVYEDRIAVQYSDEVVFGKRIEKTSDGISDTIGGKYLDFPVEIARNPGISYRLESEALGNPGVLPYVAARVPIYAGYGRTAFTGHVMELAKTKPQAFADMARRNMDSLKKAAVKDAGRIYYGDGTGLLAAVSSVSGPGNTIIVLNDPGRNITMGMQVDVLVRSTGVLLVVTRNVTAIVKGATETTITVDGGTFTTLTTHGVYRAGNRNLATVVAQREPTGMGAIAAATGALHNIDPATSPVWAGEDVALGGALTEAAMGTRCDNIRLNGGKVSAIFCSLGVRRAYFNILKAGRQFHNTVEFAGGYKALPFHNGDEIPVVDDVDCPSGNMFFSDESQLSIRQTHEWKFVDEGGSIFEKRTGFHVFDVTLYKFWELCTYQRNSQGRMTTITEA